MSGMGGSPVGMALMLPWDCPGEGVSAGDEGRLLCVLSRGSCSSCAVLRGRWCSEPPLLCL